MTFNGDFERRFSKLLLTKISQNSKFFETLNGRLPLKHSSYQRQALPKRDSDDPRYFIFRREKICAKLRTAVYPPRMAPIGVKLWENAFQVIPNISFFGAQNIFCDKMLCRKKRFRQHPKNCLNKVPVLEELCRFTHHCRMQLENSLPELSVSAFYDFWRWGKKGKTVFVVSFGLKKLIPSSFLEILFTFVCESLARVSRVNKAFAGITVTALIVFRINKEKILKQ